MVGPSTLSSTASGDRAVVLLSDDPLSRGVAYTMSALGTALIAFAAVWWLAERYRDTGIVDWLRRAGQTSLSIYLAHALVFCLLVDWLDLITPGGLGTSLTVSVAVGMILAEAQKQRLAAGLYEKSRLTPEERDRTLFEWSYPDIAERCRQQGRPYPALMADGRLASNPLTDVSTVTE